MPSQKLDPRQRLLLVASAFAIVFAMSMLQCAALSVDDALRSALTATATALCALCAAMLLEDGAVRPLRQALRRLPLRPRPASE